MFHQWNSAGHGWTNLKPKWRRHANDYLGSILLNAIIEIQQTGINFIIVMPC